MKKNLEKREESVEPLKPKIKAPNEIDIYVLPNSESVKRVISYFHRSPTIFLSETSNDIILRTTLITFARKLNLKPEFDFKRTFNSIDFLEKKITSEIELSKTYHEKFTNITPLETSPIEESGKVVFLEIATQELTVGMVFDSLQLNETTPVARYKNFYKIFNNVKVLDDISSDTLENNELYVYRYEKRRGKKSVEVISFPQIYIQNTTFGFIIQVLLLNDSMISTVEKLFEFLHFPKDTLIQKQYNRGLLGSFTMNNPKPSNYPRENTLCQFANPNIQ